MKRASRMPLSALRPSAHRRGLLRRAVVALSLAGAAALVLPACASEASGDAAPHATPLSTASPAEPIWRTVSVSDELLRAPHPFRSRGSSLGHDHKTSSASTGYFPRVSPSGFVSAGGDSVAYYLQPGDAFYSDSVADVGGNVVAAVHLQVIFWGAAWQTATGPSEHDVTSMMQTLFLTTYFDQLRQYGYQSADIRGVTTVTSAPPGTFASSDVANFVGALVGSGYFPDPDDAWGDNVYVVVMPSSSTGPSTELAAHGSTQTGSVIDTDDVPYVWIQQATIDQMSETFSHEIAETISDPQTNGFAWLMDRSFSVGEDNENEISDACLRAVDTLDGILVQGYFSGSLKACVIPFQPAPTITSVVPGYGPEWGGQTVTITGTNFDTLGPTQFTFGNAPAVGVQCASTTTCTAVTPAGSGVVDVQATVNDFTFTGSSASKYRFGPPTPDCSASFQCFDYTGGTEISCPYGLAGLTLLRWNGAAYVVVPNVNTTAAIDAFIDYFAPAAGTVVSYEVMASDSTGNSTAAPMSVTAVDCSCHPESFCGQAQCGPGSDGCGGTISCGTCPSGQTCSNNMCCPAGETYDTVRERCATKVAQCPKGEGDCGGFCCKCGPNNPC